MNDDIGYPEPPMEQAEVDQALMDEIRDAMIDGIPEWERAGYDKLVEMVNGPELEDEIESVEGCDHCRIVNGELLACPKCVAYAAKMYRLYLAGALNPEVDDDDPDAIPERDIDWELKAERENSR